MFKKITAFFLIAIYLLTTVFGNVIISSCSTQTSSCSKQSKNCCCQTKSIKKCSHSKFSILIKKQQEHNINEVK
ncbi:MAG: hypothetical protein ORN85_09770, partial [Sediminibacterium sp.]|nr:hypothetical protein [Sediminibacterium sp.]